MKAVLVIDMPSKCKDCCLIFQRIDGLACKPTRSTVDEDKKPEWCPLRPLLLGEELRKFRGTIKDKNTLIGFNMAIAICNKYLGETE